VIFASASTSKGANYVRQNTGSPRRANHHMLAKLKAKSVVARRGSGNGLSYRDADRVPQRGSHHELNITLRSAGKKIRTERAGRHRGPTRGSFRLGEMLEGWARNPGLHAAGVGDLRTATCRFLLSVAM